MPTARELAEELVRLSLTDDIAQVDLFAEDAIHELPFSPTGNPISFTREQMRAAMSAGGPPRVVDRTLVGMTVAQFRDADSALAEYDVRGVLVESGEPVSISGAMVVTARDGLIVRSRNYLNPDVLRRMNTPTS
jgi:ketosteroid isomerase-like protein